MMVARKRDFVFMPVSSTLHIQKRGVVGHLGLNIGWLSAISGFLPLFLQLYLLRFMYYIIIEQIYRR